MNISKQMTEFIKKKNSESERLIDTRDYSVCTLSGLRSGFYLSNKYRKHGLVYQSYLWFL